jgi:hypothetical protein
MHHLSILLLLMSLCIPGCVVPPAESTQPGSGSCTLQTPPTASDEEVIGMVLMAEGRLVVEQNLEALMALWSTGAEVINAKNTPDDRNDDQIWLDKDAIRHRYVRTVFPGAPTQVTPKDLQIQIMDNRAVVTATTQIGAEVSPAGDRWVLVKQNNCWEIQSLTYNLETN